MNDIKDTIFKEIYITEYGREKCSALKDIVTAAKKWHRFHYVLFGKGKFIINEKEYNLSQGDIFYIPDNATPRYYPDKKDPWIYAWVGFNGDNVKKYLENCNISQEKPIFKDHDFILKNDFNDFVDSCNRAGEVSLYALGIVLQIFYKMMEMNKSKKKSLTTKEIYVKEAQQFIENNYQFNITITTISESLNISPNYLANIFSDVMGMPTKKYLTKVRMEKACYMLINEDLPIKDIAKKVGYDNQLHFSSEFKKIKQISPLLYRERNVLY